MLPGCQVGAFSGSASPGMLVSGAVRLLGFSMTNTSATVLATFSILDGGTGGLEAFRVNLLGNESTREWFGLPGIAFEQGLFVTRTAGGVVGALFYLPETFVDDDEYVGPTRTG